MKFGEALEKCKSGERIARSGWNGKDQFVFLLPGAVAQKAADEALGAWNYTGLAFCDVLCIKTTRNQIQTGWLASQSDMLADDWEVLK